MPREMVTNLYYKHDIDNLHAEPRIKLRAIYTSSKGMVIISMTEKITKL